MPNRWNFARPIWPICRGCSNCWATSPLPQRLKPEPVMRIETALAKGSLTPVERRDPKRLYHKMTTQQLGALSPSFQWKTYFARVGLPSVEALNVETPEFFRALNTELQGKPGRAGRLICAGSWSMLTRLSSRPIS